MGKCPPPEPQLSTTWITSCDSTRLRTCQFLKDLLDPNKRGFVASFLSTIQDVEVVTSTGIFTGEKATTYKVDLNRLRRVAARVVRGLFYVETGSPLPHEYLAAALAENDCSDRERRPRFAHLGNMAASLPSFTAEHVRGNGVIRYWYKIFDEDRYTSMWLLRFFDNYHFVGLTVNPNVLTSARLGHLSFP